MCFKLQFLFSVNVPKTRKIETTSKCHSSKTIVTDSWGLYCWLVTVAANIFKLFLCYVNTFCFFSVNLIFRYLHFWEIWHYFQVTRNLFFQLTCNYLLSCSEQNFKFFFTLNKFSCYRSYLIFLKKLYKVHDLVVGIFINYIL